mmetsp:Transcript_88/g.88  ORF Transcript_88/g.88 Transcript_88/m.88 type:complete len:98 (-) Transcript_88:515-808(-)
MSRYQRNEGADQLAETGRKASPLYIRAGNRPERLWTPIAASPPRVATSPAMDTGSVLRVNIEVISVVSDADPAAAPPYGMWRAYLVPGALFRLRGAA